MNDSGLTIQSVIQKWMMEAVKAGLRSDPNDLHIDAIDEEYKPKKQWLNAALTCLDAAIVLRDRHQLPFVVVLSIHLRSECEPIGVNFSTFMDLENELSFTPPSLYLFDPDSELWRHARSRWMRIDFPDLAPALRLECVFTEVPDKYHEDLFRGVMLYSLPGRGE